MRAVAFGGLLAVLLLLAMPASAAFDGEEECIATPKQILHGDLGASYGLRNEEAAVRIVEKDSKDTWKTACPVQLAKPAPNPNAFDCEHEDVIGDDSVLRVSASSTNKSELHMALYSNSEEKKPYFETDLRSVPIVDMPLKNGQTLFLKGRDQFVSVNGNYDVYLYMRHNTNIGSNQADPGYVYKTYRLELFRIKDKYKRCLDHEPEKGGQFKVLPEDKLDLVRKSDNIDETQVGDGSEPKRR